MSTTQASHSRLKSSMTHRTRKRRPSDRLSDIEPWERHWSEDHGERPATIFGSGLVGLPSAHGGQSPVFARRACAPSGPLRGRPDRVSSSSFSSPPSSAEYPSADNRTAYVLRTTLSTADAAPNPTACLTFADRQADQAPPRHTPAAGYSSSLSWPSPRHVSEHRASDGSAGSLERMAFACFDPQHFLECGDVEHVLRKHLLKLGVLGL